MMPDTLNVLTGKTMPDEQLTWIGADFEIGFGVLRTLEQKHQKH